MYAELNLLINVKMPTMVVILTFMSITNCSTKSYKLEARPRGFKPFSCSTQLCVKIMLINVKMPTKVLHFKIQNKHDKYNILELESKKSLNFLPF